MTGKAGADWLTIDAEGHATMDIKVLLLTDDGAHGVRDPRRPRRLEPVASAAARCSRCARLESGDERYQWVNHLPLVAKGSVIEGGGVAHELFELV